MKPLFEPTTLAQPRILANRPTVESASYCVRVPEAAPAPPAPARALVITEDQVVTIGADAANALKSVSQELLSQVNASDAAEFGKGLNDLVSLAKGLTPEQLQDHGFMGRLKGVFSNAKERLIRQYTSVDGQIEALVQTLDRKAMLHQQRIADLERLYTSNYEYHQGLDAAVKQCESLLAQITQQLAQENLGAGGSSSFEAQRVADYQRLLQRLEKRISDLERAKLLSKQVAPQIRMMQDDARSLVGSFGDIKVVTIPAWRNTFSLYVLQQEQQASAALLAKIGDATDQALRQGAELLHQNSVETAKARNRDVVALDTLQHINQQLIGALEDVKRIDAEGRARRQADRPKLRAMEADLVKAFAEGKR